MTFKQETLSLGPYPRKRLTPKPRPSNLPDWYAQRLTRQLTATLARQNSRPGPDHGGFASADGWVHGRETAYVVGHWLGAWCYAESLGLAIQPLEAAIESGLDFLLRRQSPDGRLDLRGVYSANEAGFPLPALTAGYRHIRCESGEFFDRIADRLQTFITRAADAVAAGEAYSANHRWAALAAPLAAVHQTFPHDRYIERAYEILEDPIDCDEYGFWFEERSPNYNTVANHGMLILADALDRHDLMKHVIRNLRLQLLLIQPNGEADASFSFRQDRGRPNRPIADYRVTRRAAMLSGDGRLTSLALHVRDQSPNESLMPLSLEWLDHPGPMPPAENMPVEFERDWPDRKLARWRSGDTALTLAADQGNHFFDTVLDSWGGHKRSEDWFHLHHGKLVIQSLRLDLAAPGAIQPRSLDNHTPGRYVLEGTSEGWPHSQHFRPGAPTITMPHRSRHHIEVAAEKHRVDIGMDVDSSDVLRATLRLYVRAGAVLEGVGLLEAGRNYVPETAEWTLRDGRHKIRCAGWPSNNYTPSAPKPAKIPSQLTDHCAILSVGVRLPINLQMQFQLGSDL